MSEILSQSRARWRDGIAFSASTRGFSCFFFHTAERHETAKNSCALARLGQSGYDMKAVANAGVHIVAHDVFLGGRANGETFVADTKRF